MLNNSVSNKKSFIIKTLLYGSAITVIVVALLLGSFMPQNVAYADTEESYINFNQIAYDFNATNYNKYANATTQTFGNHSLTINNNGYNTSSNYVFGFQSLNTFSFIQNHKYYISIDILCSYVGNINMELWRSYSVTSQLSTVADETVKLRQIKTADVDTTRNIVIYIGNSSANNTGTTTYSNFMIIDLTLCFGEEKADMLTVDDVSNIFVSEYYSYTLGTVINESNATDYASGYIDGVNDTLSNFTVNATMGDSYNFLTTVDYKNYISTITKEIFTIDNQQFYGCGCQGYVKLPFYIKGSTSLKLNILAFMPWGAGADMDNTIYYDIGYIYNGEFINLYNTSMPKTADGIRNAEYEFFIPVDIDGIVFNCSETYMLVNITAQYQTYDVQDAIYKAEQRGFDNGHENGYKLGKAEGYELGSRSTDNLLIGGFWNWFTSMLGSISSILDIELYGGISIGVVILVPLLFTVLLLVLKLVRGNG